MARPKSFKLGGKRKFVANRINTIFPDKTSIALLGRNGAGKSTLLKIMGGTMRPDSGEVQSEGSISWQIGFAGSFHPDLTGMQNTRFIARVYGIDTNALETYVQDFSELGASFKMSVRTYSSGMRARLAFGISMGIPFSYYLIDEVTSVGDASFKEKYRDVLEDRLDSAGSVVVSHNEGLLRSICSAGAMLENGQSHYFPDIENANALHGENMKKKPA